MRGDVEDEDEDDTLLRFVVHRQPHRVLPGIGPLHAVAGMGGDVDPVAGPQFDRPACLEPILTAGIPRKGPSRMDALELPILQAQRFIKRT